MIAVGAISPCLMIVFFAVLSWGGGGGKPFCGLFSHYDVTGVEREQLQLVFLPANSKVLPSCLPRVRRREPYGDTVASVDVYLKALASPLILNVERLGT